MGAGRGGSGGSLKDPQRGLLVQNSAGASGPERKTPLLNCCVKGRGSVPKRGHEVVCWVKERTDPEGPCQGAGAQRRETLHPTSGVQKARRGPGWAGWVGRRECKAGVPGWDWKGDKQAEQTLDFWEAGEGRAARRPAAVLGGPLGAQSLVAWPAGSAKGGWTGLTCGATGGGGGRLGPGSPVPGVQRRGERV